MSNLVFEILLRLAKAGIALVLGLVLYGDPGRASSATPAPWSWRCCAG